MFLAIAKEKFPFTNDPMYSRPGPGPITQSIFADAKKQPLPTHHHSQITSPRMKRLIERRLSSHRKDFPAVAEEQRIEEGMVGVFKFLRTSSQLRHRPLPAEPLQIYRGEIFQLKKGFDEKVFLVRHSIDLVISLSFPLSEWSAMLFFLNPAYGARRFLPDGKKYARFLPPMRLRSSRSRHSSATSPFTLATQQA